MKFGYFDDQNKEYVITTPQTPLPWINYLGSEDRTRQYSAVPAGLWLQSLLLRLFPQEYIWLRNIKG